jgi:sirohydrochlorin cobaltochelatase
MSPNLETCAGTLAAEGFRSVIVVPMFIAQGGHLKNDVPLLMEKLRQQHPQVEFRVSPPVGEAEPIVAAMADYALDLIPNIKV